MIEIKTALDHLLLNSYVKLGPFYKQIKGIPMEENTS